MKRELAKRGIKGATVTSRWLSTSWCEPKHGGPLFKVAQVSIGYGGRFASKHVNVEQDGSWDMR